MIDEDTKFLCYFVTVSLKKEYEAGSVFFSHFLYPDDIFLIIMLKIQRIVSTQVLEVTLCG